MSVAAPGRLRHPIYQRRDWVVAGECGRQSLKDLEAWVKGARFHPYGVQAYERGPTLSEALQRMRDYPALLDYIGRLNDYGYVDFAVRWRQAGDPESWGLSTPHFTPEDAAYAALRSSRSTSARSTSRTSSSGSHERPERSRPSEPRRTPDSGWERLSSPQNRFQPPSQRPSRAGFPRPRG